MPQTFAFKTTPPARKLAKMFGDAGKEITDWRPAWRKFAPLIGPEMARALRGGGFTRNDPAWAKRKHGKPIGIFSGKLAGDLFGNVARQSISKKRLRWGPKAKYAYIFHHGVEGRQIARPFLGWTKPLEQAVQVILAERAEQVMEQAVRDFEGGGG